MYDAQIKRIGGDEGGAIQQNVPASGLGMSDPLQ